MRNVEALFFLTIIITQYERGEIKSYGFYLKYTVVQNK